ncbi:hypothetical protein [Rubrobacter indicoceani]|uniref:hypothetical protein n=1 Tax=Rubrobacter indicoceani TaxID=2051957 RepID=UPI000E5B70F2|nr:hypothetical protein [Rubrobacter indicoceani]
MRSAPCPDYAPGESKHRPASAGRSEHIGAEKTRIKTGASGDPHEAVYADRQPGRVRYRWKLLLLTLFMLGAFTARLAAGYASMPP